MGFIEPTEEYTELLTWNDALLNDESTTNYEKARAGPSGGTSSLVLMWSIYSGILFVFSLGIAIIFLAIICNRKVRRNPFNKYLLFLSIPDFVFSFLCVITCLLSAIKASYYSWEMCVFQTFYISWGMAANSWLNGFIAWEIHRLLLSSHKRQRYFPPTNKQVYKRALMAYALALLTSLPPILLHDFDWFPSRIGLRSGWLCLTMEYDTASTVFFWVFIIPMYCGIPYLYAMYVLYDIVIRHKLLPPRGRRRELAVYFFRIFICFLIFWLPAVITMRFFAGVSPPWIVWSFGLFAHGQGLGSSLLTLLKRDIKLAVQDFVCCCCGGRSRSNNSRRRREKRRRSSHLVVYGEFSDDDCDGGGGRSSSFFVGGGRSSNFFSTGFSQYFRALNGRQQEENKQQHPCDRDHSKSTFDVDLSNRQNALASRSSSKNSDSESNHNDYEIDLSANDEEKTEEEEAATSSQQQTTTARQTTNVVSSSTTTILQRMKRSLIESIFSSTNDNDDDDLHDDEDGDNDDDRFGTDEDDRSCTSSVSSIGLPRQLDDFRFEDEAEEIIFHQKEEDFSDDDDVEAECDKQQDKVDTNDAKINDDDGGNNAAASVDDDTIIDA